LFGGGTQQVSCVIISSFSMIISTIIVSKDSYRRCVATGEATQQQPLSSPKKPSHPFQIKCKQASVSVFHASRQASSNRFHFNSIVLFRMLVWYSCWSGVFGSAYDELFRMTVRDCDI
jgi:hypothetical protein